MTSQLHSDSTAPAVYILPGHFCPVAAGPSNRDANHHGRQLQPACSQRGSWAHTRARSLPSAFPFPLQFGWLRVPREVEITGLDFTQVRQRSATFYLPT